MRPSIRFFATLTLGIFTSIDGLYSQNFIGRLPDSITLQDSQKVLHTLTPNCGNQYCYFGLPSAFNPSSYDFSYSTNGGSSTLELLATQPSVQNPPYGGLALFYVGHLSVGANSHLKISEFHSIAVRNGISLGENATLTISLRKGEKLPPSELFDSSSLLNLARSQSLFLANGATLHLSNADKFKLDAQGIISENAKMEIDTNLSILSYKLNNEGVIVFNGDVHNVGQTDTGVGTATAVLINKGQLDIKGNFYNGDADVSKGGGGSLINYGGNINIAGKLINQVFANDYGHADSNVQIYGGSLKVTAGIENKDDSTIIIGAYKGQMGAIDANLENNGKIELDITGAQLGSHQIITGNVTGGGKIELSESGQKNTLIDKRLQNGSLTLSKNEGAISALLAGIDANQSEIIKELDNSLQSQKQTIYTYGDSAYLSNLSRRINTSASSILHSQPLNMWNMLQNTLTPLIYETQVSPISFSMTPFASRGSSDALNTPLYGASAKASLAIQNIYAMHAFLTYANGQGNDADSYSQTSLNTHSFLAGIQNSLMLSRTRLSFLAYYGYSSQKSKRIIGIDQTPLNADSNYQEIGFQGSIAYPVIRGHWLIKPFAGLDYTMGFQGGFRESTLSPSLSKLSAQSQTSTLLQLTLGTQIYYFLSKQHKLITGMQIHQALLSPFLSANFGNAQLIFKDKNSFGYTLHIGGSMLLHQRVTASIYGLYAHSVQNFNTLSAMLNLSYSF